MYFVFLFTLKAFHVTGHLTKWDAALGATGSVASTLLKNKLPLWIRTALVPN
jgi:hypothetical protein